MDVEKDRPSDRLTITYQGEPKELFMSFLRLNQCVRVLGGPKNLPAMMLDPDIMEGMIGVVLSEPGHLHEFKLGENDLNHEDVDKVLEWVQEHLTHFFMKRFQQLTAHKQLVEPAAKSLLSSLLGSVSSISNEAAVGPLT